MRAVLDTNIVIDLLHFADPPTQGLRRAIASGVVLCFTDRDCLAELQRVSVYRQFQLDPAAQRALLDGYRRIVFDCDAADPESTASPDDCVLPRCRDVDDQKFLILALRCRADLLITRDRQLLRLSGRRCSSLPYRIVNTSEASRLIDEQQLGACKVLPMSIVSQFQELL